MISPYVRRLRLGSEIRALRAEADLTAAQLAKQIGRSRADISRLENGHVVDQADVLNILEAVGVDGDRWTKIMTIAREASETGWWESSKTMGDRQAMFANLEAGATNIREYQQIFIPGLLQTSEYARARTDPAATLEQLQDGSTPDGIVAGRMMRQRIFRRPGGPDYEVIVDELAIRRLAAAPEVVKKSLYHMATLVNDSPKITLRVLPVDARPEGYAVPRTSFTVYTFADPDDPVIVAISTITAELFLTEPTEVASYEELFTRLRKEALPDGNSLDLVNEMAARLGDE
jgi:transcriptional regulator with XRE-family HTH domain